MGKEYGGWNWQMMSRKYEDGEMKKKVGEGGWYVFMLRKLTGNDEGLHGMLSIAY